MVTAALSGNRIKFSYCGLSDRAALPSADRIFERTLCSG
ncbi:hypothetical protein H1P_710009 [Hyella patelloides LEGE 07179]|uniref:Uncharacterized protein n=1 Tax=Hyella patelloides LEGE 07179 TaxID=945734 RepID=A0A563W3J4_9CYAN|nr:hypothetical protein H1P_710009 [Hyella patelloides LEGE 07179]